MYPFLSVDDHTIYTYVEYVKYLPVLVTVLQRYMCISMVIHTYILYIFIERETKIYFKEMAHMIIENGNYKGKIRKVGQRLETQGKH